MESKTPSCSYKFNILHEAVPLNDQFPDKTHQKVADALFKLIQNSTHGITIGLEGGWGSGKSTVVNFLKQLLVSDSDTLFFLFDAWAHEGDPLRRIFLESLIDEVEPSGSGSGLLQIKDKISGKKRKVESTTKKMASRLGSLISLSAIFVPFGAAILSTIDYGTLHFPWGRWDHSPHIPFITGFIFALAPFWVLVLWRFFGTEDKSNVEKKNFWNGGKQWDVFAAGTTEDYTQDITEDNERTSVEFERYFEEIIKSSVGEDKKFKKALFVIDNLDRVEPEQTLAIFSILQTFFQYRSKQEIGSKNSWRSKLWFLIPYDRESLSKVWSEPNNFPDRVETSLNNPALSDSKAISEKGLASSFFEKCFQVIAEVPEPVMSAWVDYCGENTKRALTGWPEKEVDEVIETFKRFESRLESSPSPRQILVFINRVGFLGLRWGGEMSAEAIALYALIRKDRSDGQLRKELLADGLPNQYEGMSHSSELKIQLAGMLFGVEKNKGIQLLLMPEINAALKNGDSEKISSLVDIHKEAFWVVWTSIKKSSLPHGHTEEYLITATLAFCKGVSAHKDKAASSINHLVSEWKSKGSNWQLDKHEYSKAVHALLEVAPESSKLLLHLEKTVKKFIEDTVLSISAFSPQGDIQFDPSLIPNLSKLIDLLISLGVNFSQTHYSTLGNLEWKTWKNALDTEQVKIACVLPAKGTIKSIAEAINISDPDAEYIKLLISTLFDTPSSEEWDYVADKLAEWSNYVHNWPCSNDVYELMLSIYLRSKISAADKIKNCVTSAQFTQNTQYVDVNQSFYLLVLLVVVLRGELLSSNLGGNINTYWQSDFDWDRHGRVMEALKKFNILHMIWGLAMDPQNKASIGMIKSGRMDGDIYISEDGLLCLDQYTWASDKELHDFVLNFSKYGGLVKSKQKLVQNPVHYRGCLKLVGAHGGEVGEFIVEEAIKSTTAVQWEEALIQDRLLFDCLRHQGNHEFKDGFIAFATKELNSGNLSSHVWDNFSEFYGKLMDKEDVAITLAKEYFKLDTEPFLTDKAFVQFSSTFANSLPEINSSHLMKRVEDWLAEPSWSKISWLLETEFKFFGKPKQSLVSRVKTNLAEAEEENEKKILIALANVFQIDIDEYFNTNAAGSE